MTTEEIRLGVENYKRTTGSSPTDALIQGKHFEISDSGGCLELKSTSINHKRLGKHFKEGVLQRRMNTAHRLGCDAYKDVVRGKCAFLPIQDECEDWTRIPVEDRKKIWDSLTPQVELPKNGRIIFTGTITK